MIITTVVILVVITSLYVNGATTDPTFDKVYSYPTYYWQFGKSVEAMEVIKNESPIVQGSDYFKITGPGDGYLNFPIKKSSANLGVFKEPCLLDVSQCTDGLTIAFWVRIDDVKLTSSISPSKVELFGVSSLVKDTVKVGNKIENGKLYLTISLYNTSHEYHAQQMISQNEWNHVTLQYKNANNQLEIRTFFNVGLLPAGLKENSSKGVPSPKEVSVTLGQNPWIDVPADFGNANFSFDNLAIWTKYLTIKEIEKVYFALFGQLKVIENCFDNDENNFQIKWFAPVDYYNHLLSYKIYWWSQQNSETNIALINSVKTKSNFSDQQSGSDIVINLEMFDKDQSYTVGVDAVLRSGLTKDVSLDCPKNSIKDDNVTVEVDSPTSLLFTWVYGDVQANFKINVTCHSSIDGPYFVTRDMYNWKELKDYKIDGLKPSSLCVVTLKKYYIDQDITFIYKRKVEIKALDLTSTTSTTTTTRTTTTPTRTTTTTIATTKTTVTATTIKPVIIHVGACSKSEARGMEWPPTNMGEIAVIPCPKGTVGFATRECINRTVGVWGKPDLSNCTSKEWLKIQKMKLTPGSVKAAKTLQNFVSTQAEIYGGDLSNLVDVMGNVLSEDSLEGNKTVSNEFVGAVAGLSSDLLEEKALRAWHDLPKDGRSKKAGSLLGTTDLLAKASAQNNNGSVDVIKTNNLVMEVQKVSMKKKKKGEVIILPQDVFAIEDATLAVIDYNGIGELLGVPGKPVLRPSVNGTPSLNSKVKSVSIFPKIERTFEDPIVIVLPLNEAPNQTEPNCVYWVKPLDGSKTAGFWSDNGCFVASSNNTHVVCNCYHLTNFAILMSVNGAADEVDGTHELLLSYITMIGIAVSLVGLVASFFTFILVKKVRSLRNTIHQNLCVALFAGELLFLLGIEKTEYEIGCQVIAATLHYFFLAAFFIMALEGIVLYLMLVRVYRSRSTYEYGSFKYLIVCWVLPLVFITLNLCLDKQAYAANRDFCWLSLRQKFIWSFVGPVIFVISFNFVIFIMTLKIMSTKAKTRPSAAEEIWFWSKGCCLLLCILGLTWILGVFYVDKNTVYFGYAFCIINSLQGMGIYVFHCLCDPRVRKAYYEFFFCVKQREAYVYRSNSRGRSISSNSRSSFLSKVTRKKFGKKSGNGGNDHIRLCNGTSGNMTPDKMSYCGDQSTPNNSVGLLTGTGKC